ncbi:MAG: electron transport complex subunit RsxC [Phycisphaerae bacterium]|jgi:electron transport complex protein RnfC
MITKQLHSFFGGVHPLDYKGYTEDKAIQPGPAVKTVTIPLSQHIGAVCQPVVNKGDAVEAGQIIGKSDAFVSAPVHSPIEGKVKEIALASHAILGRCLSIIIEADAPAAPVLPADFDARFDDSGYTAEQICTAVAPAGLVGMGGAGFPTRIKIDPAPPKEVLLVNGCECEPFITCDYRLMLEWTNKIIAGIRLAKKAVGCKRVIIAIEDNKPKAIELLASNAQVRQAGIEIVPVKTRYPQGGERQLINTVLGRQVKTGSIPPAIGVLVMNVATAAAVADAVVNRKPLTHRVVTVTGEAIAQPANLYTAIGTSVGELIEFCGGLTKKGAKVIMGGPMTGTAIADLSTPIVKTTGAITVLTKRQVGRAKHDQRVTPCIRCGRCIEVCPEKINPTKIAHAVMHNMMDEAKNYYISACIECGCCSYICPANIELTGYIKTGKVLLAREQKKMPK